MELTLFHWGELLTLLMVAIALGMDAFSLGIGVGMSGLRLLDVAKVSLVIGLFHFLMPLAGMLLGLFLTGIIGHIAVSIGGGILLFLGLHMLWSGLVTTDGPNTLRVHGGGLLLFAVSVSLDALSAGVSFGLLEVNRWLAITLFGIVSTILSAGGMLLGRGVRGWLGKFGEVFGGLILISFGVKFLF